MAAILSWSYIYCEHSEAVTRQYNTFYIIPEAMLMTFLNHTYYCPKSAVLDFGHTRRTFLCHADLSTEIKWPV